MSDTTHTLHRQTEAARELLATLRAEGADDDADLVADAIEGETSLLEAIGAAIAEIDEAELLIIGGKEKAKQILSRVAAEETRVDRIRAMVERALVTIDLDKPLRLPTATVSLVRRAPQPVIVNEAEIPGRFFVQPPAPPPKLDKKALAAALKTETIPGAMLDNGSASLMIRRS